MEIDLHNEKPRTIQDICEIFWDLENNLNLLDANIQNIKFWQIIRFKTYRYVSELTKLQEKAHSELKSIDKLKKVGSFLKNSFINNPFFKKNQFDVIVFSHPRSKLVDGEYIDIYTEYFLDSLNKDNIKFLELESAYLGEHIRKMNAYKSYTDFIVFCTNIFKKITTIRFTKEEDKLIFDINKYLSDCFDTKVDITDILIDSIKVFKLKYYFYTKLLKKLSPKVVYIVVSYGSADIVKAAKDLDIKVVELQHGIFSEFHLGYSYPNRTKKLDFFPGEFLVWSEYWKDLLKLPIDNDNIKIKPFEFLEINKQKYKDIKKLDQIVVLSQGNVGNTIARLVLKNIKLFKDLKIVYKLHPGEYDRYKNYNDLTKLIKNYKNIEVVEDVNLHKLLASSKYQLGINSTALLEGVEFGCKSILLDTSGIEYMTKFIVFHKLIKKNDLFLDQKTAEDLNL